MKELGVEGRARAAELLHPAHRRSSSTRKGRKLIGWDEILEGGLAPNATVMSWRGIDGAIAAAKAGHDTVLSPAPDLYFDHWQSRWRHFAGPQQHAVARDVYRFDPVPASIAPEQRKHILGLQANLWAEMMRSEARVTYMAFPRVAALAEVAWSPPSRIDWDDFQRRAGRAAPALRQRSASSMRAKSGVEPGPRRRVSHDLEQCGGGYLLSLEDDAPIEGERADVPREHHRPCWIWRGADLTKVESIRASVGQIPVQLPDRQGRGRRFRCRSPRRRDGELEIRAGRLRGCADRDRVARRPPVATTGSRRCRRCSRQDAGQARPLLQIHARARWIRSGSSASVELVGS